VNGWCDSMGYIYVLIAIFILAAFISYPIISTIVTILLIMLVVHWYKSAEESALEKSQNAVDIAVHLIEEACLLAVTKRWLEPFFLTMYVDENKELGEKGFKVILSMHCEYLEGAEREIEGWHGWECKMDESRVYLENGFPFGIKCGWNTFNAEVWRIIREKHSNLKVRYIRDDKSGIEF